MSDYIPGMRLVLVALHHLKETEKKLGLPTDFFRKIDDETDWGFILKLSALAETATVNLLQTRFNNDATKELARIEMRRRLDLLLSQDMLSKSLYRVLVWFSEIRNLIAHNISAVSFSLDDYFRNPDEKKEFKKIFINFFKGDSDEEGRRKLIDERPRVAIKLALIGLLCTVYMNDSTIRQTLKNIYSKDPEPSLINGGVV